MLPALVRKIRSDATCEIDFLCIRRDSPFPCISSVSVRHHAFRSMTCHIAPVRRRSCKEEWASQVDTSCWRSLAQRSPLDATILSKNPRKHGRIRLAFPTECFEATPHQINTSIDHKGILS
jgi:hypothetical protein